MPGIGSERTLAAAMVIGSRCCCRARNDARAFPRRKGRLITVGTRARDTSAVSSSGDGHPSSRGDRCVAVRRRSRVSPPPSRSCCSSSRTCCRARSPRSSSHRSADQTRPMSIVFDSRIDIRRPLREAFSTLTDVGGWPKWASTVESFAQTSPPPVQVGSRLLQLIRCHRELADFAALLRRESEWSAEPARSGPGRGAPAS